MCALMVSSSASLAILGAGHTRVPASAAAGGRRAKAPLFAATEDSSVDSMLERVFARAEARVEGTTTAKPPTVPASSAAIGRRAQNPLFAETDDSSVDSMFERIAARSKARTAGLKTAEPPTDDDSSVDSEPGAPYVAPPLDPPMQHINEEERSRCLLMDDDVSEINESQLPNDSQGSFADGEPSIRPVTIDHFVKPAFKNDYDWFSINDADDVDTNGPLAPLKWRFIGADGEFMEELDDVSDTKRTPLDYFLASMPPATIKRVLKETNEKLLEREADELAIAELLRFFGVCILITRFKFGRRRELWGQATGSKYIPTANIADTGMSRHRFEEIWSVLSFSHQEPERPYGMSSADYRWTLVDDFVNDFNRHRRARFRPSERVSADTILFITNITTADLY
jgi:Transposase IS4